MASGAFESIVIGGRRFPCKSDDSPKVSLKGKENETIMHGDGSHHVKQTWVPGHISDINVIIDDTRDDLGFLQNLQDKGELVPITATKVSGAVLSGNVQIIDKIEIDEGESTVELNLEGDIEQL